MVFAIACLIVNWTGSGALTAGRPGREVFDAIGELKSSSGLIRRRRPGRESGKLLDRLFGNSLGARTAAPPIIMPGINATSSSATPAAITPTVATVVITSCVRFARSPPAGIVGSE